MRSRSLGLLRHAIYKPIIAVIAPTILPTILAISEALRPLFPEDDGLLGVDVSEFEELALPPEEPPPIAVFIDGEDEL